MRKLALAILLLLVLACSSQTQLPMASFIVTTQSSEDTTTVWNKVRVILLKNGFAWFSDKGSDTKNFVLKSDQNATVIVTKNADKGFVEVVFFHTKKSSFGESEERTFRTLMSTVQQEMKDHKVSDGVPFRRGN